MTGQEPASGFYETVQGTPSQPITTETWLGSLRMNYNFADMDLSSTTSYRRVRYDATLEQDFVPAVLQQVTSAGDGLISKSFTQELRLASSFNGPFNFTTGAFYEHGNNNFALNLFGAVFGGLSPILDNTDKLDSWSLFGEVYYDILPQLKLTVGARYSSDKKDHSFVNNADASAIFGTASGAISAKFTNFTPRAVLNYDAGFANFYVSYNRGFKSGGFNSPAPVIQPKIDPEKITAYEVGAKFNFDGGRGRLDLAAFHYNWTNLQVAFIDSTTGGLFTQNAASAKNDGVEGSLSYRAIPGLTFNVSALYMDSRYSSFPSAAVFVPRPGGGLMNGAEDVTGFATPRAPKFSGSASVNYELEVGNGWQVALNALGTHSSSYDFSSGAGGPLRFARQEAYSLLNLSATVTFPGDKLSITAFGTNVTQTHYANARVIGALGGYQTAAEPAIYGVRVKYEF